jgi:phenylacetic acid degradation operon negative regulatory protein
MSEISSFIQHRVKQASISCKSLIVTVFGDTISQHGGWVWLSSLIAALEPLGYSERLVRTSVFRLVQEDWLQTKKIGRCSYYAFTESAKRHYQKAEKRIYAAKHDVWDGHWLLAIPTQVSEDKLPTLKKQLHWLGFNTLIPGIFAHPSFDRESLIETIDELDLSGAIIIFNSKTIDGQSEKALKNQVAQKWQINTLSANYSDLISHYHDFGELISQNNVHKNLDLSPAEHNQGRFSGSEAFLIRTLLIHEYRRILLKDYELPSNMLPIPWAGSLAQELVKSLYGSLATLSNQYISDTLENESGKFGQEADTFKLRFNH